MQRLASFSRLLKTTRGFCTINADKIVAAVLFERLPVVVPKIDPVVYAFQEFSYRWGQQYRRKYPDDVLGKSDARGKGDIQIEYEPAPRITEADKNNDRNYESPTGKPVWHFPEKVYEKEETMRKCAESALQSVIGDLSHTYFVGNAPFAHMIIPLKEDSCDVPSLKRFFFKSQVIAVNKFNVGKCEDYVWVTKDELIEYYPEQAAFLNQMIIS